jgi:hypothetical protein
MGSREEALDLEIQLDRVPVDDLLIVADSQASEGGVHAQARYRFGRLEPRPSIPTRTGPELKTGKANFGRAVPIR